jgi:hypothetical protein
MSMDFRLAEDGDHVIVEHQCTRPEGWPPVVAELPNGPHGWTITSREPLSVIPSILCSECGLHGYITDGQWTD